MTDEEIIASLMRLSAKHIRREEQQACRLAAIRIAVLRVKGDKHDRERINPEA